MVKTVNPEKMKLFLADFYNAPTRWYEAQIEEDFEFDEETQMKIIEEKFLVIDEAFAIQYIKNPTKEVCLKAIRKDSSVIGYIKNPTEEMCLEAVKQDGWAIEDIDNPTEEVCLEAVRKNDCVIQYINNPTEKVCLEAVKQDGLAIQYIDNPTEKVCIEAIKQNLEAIQYIEKSNQSFDIVKTYFECSEDFSWYEYENDYSYLEKKFITKEQGLIMIEDDPENIDLLSEKVKKEILEMKPELQKYVGKYKKVDDWFFN